MWVYVFIKRSNSHFRVTVKVDPVLLPLCRVSEVASTVGRFSRSVAMNARYFVIPCIFASNKDINVVNGIAKAHDFAEKTKFHPHLVI